MPGGKLTKLNKNQIKTIKINDRKIKGRKIIRLPPKSTKVIVIS